MNVTLAPAAREGAEKVTAAGGPEPGVGEADKRRIARVARDESSADGNRVAQDDRGRRVGPCSSGLGIVTFVPSVSVPVPPDLPTKGPPLSTPIVAWSVAVLLPVAPLARRHRNRDCVLVRFRCGYRNVGGQVIGG